jgi:hypothetical protein
MFSWIEMFIINNVRTCLFVASWLAFTSILFDSEVKRKYDINLRKRQEVNKIGDNRKSEGNIFCNIDLSTSLRAYPNNLNGHINI